MQNNKKLESKILNFIVILIFTILNVVKYGHETNELEAK